MKDFSFYIKNREVRKVSIDPSLAKSLKSDCIERAKKLFSLDTNNYEKIIFEGIYDCLREIADSILILDGYKSYSHEASISYLSKYGFSYEFIAEFDSFRFRRNGSKYYGKKITKQYTKKILNFYKKYIQKLIKIVNKKLEWEHEKKGCEKG